MQVNFQDSTIKDLIAYSLRGKESPDDWHITRTAMYNSLRSYLSDYDAPDKTCLSVSNSGFFGNILGLKKCAYVGANYPEHNLIDLSFPDSHFDFVVSDQVMEHVEGNPFTAFSETARVLKPGGIFCHTTCFINPVHGVPKDFWRFTLDSLRLLTVSAGCEIMQLDGWGNREAWALAHAGFRFAKIPRDPDHPLYKLATRNEPEWPIVTWVVGRKPKKPD